MIGSGAGDVFNDELIVEFGLRAHHAGCRERIHWDQAHCARGVETLSPIGQDIYQLPIREGVGKMSMGYDTSRCPISGCG